jgi:hypothetical protein
VLNSAGYFVGQVSGNLYWVTDSYYHAMFLATREGVVRAHGARTLTSALQGHLLEDVAARQEFFSLARTS